MSNNCKITEVITISSDEEPDHSKEQKVQKIKVDGCVTKAYPSSSKANSSASRPICISTDKKYLLKLLEQVPKSKKVEDHLPNLSSLKDLTVTRSGPAAGVGPTSKKKCLQDKPIVKISHKGVPLPARNGSPKNNNRNKVKSAVKVRSVAGSSKSLPQKRKSIEILAALPEKKVCFPSVQCRVDNMVFCSERNMKLGKVDTKRVDSKLQGARYNKPGKTAVQNSRVVVSNSGAAYKRPRSNIASGLSNCNSAKRVSFVSIPPSNCDSKVKTDISVVAKPPPQTKSKQNNPISSTLSVNCNLNTKTQSEVKVEKCCSPKTVALNVHISEVNCVVGNKHLDSPKVTPPASRSEGQNSAAAIQAQSNNRLTSEEVFRNYLDLIDSLLDCSEAEKTKISSVLQKHFAAAQSPYIKSNDFHLLISESVKRMKGDKGKIYVYVLDVMNELKRKRTPKSVASPNIGISYLDSKPSTSFAADNPDVTEPLIAAASVEADNVEKKRADYLKQLEKLLGRIHRKILKLQARELSLDDLDAEDSYYLREDRLKKHFVKIHKLICKTKCMSSNTGQEIYKKFRYAGTKYDLINKKVEIFINKRKKFPDYTDVYELVKSASEESNMIMSPSQVSDLAKDVFCDVGRELQRRRKMDDEYLLNAYVCGEGCVPDPADTDSELKARLDKSAEEGSLKIEKIINDFVDKQYNLKEVAVEVSDAGSSSASEDGEENPEENSDENDILEIDNDENSENDDGKSDYDKNSNDLGEGKNNNNDVEENASIDVKDCDSNNDIKEKANSNVTESYNSNGKENTSNDGKENTSNDGKENTSNDGKENINNDVMESANNNDVKEKANSNVMESYNSNDGKENTSNDVMDCDSNNDVNENDNDVMESANNKDVKEKANSNVTESYNSNDGKENTSNDVMDCMESINNDDKEKAYSNVRESDNSSDIKGNASDDVMDCDSNDDVKENSNNNVMGSSINIDVEENASNDVMESNNDKVEKNNDIDLSSPADHCAD